MNNRVIPKGIVWPFILLTCLLALLGIAMPAISLKELLTALSSAFLAAVLIDLVYRPLMKER